MRIDAEITARKEDYGPVATWKGPQHGAALVNPEVLTILNDNRRVKVGEVYDVGRLKVRVVVFPYFSTPGAKWDDAAVMLESPHAQLYQWYRERAEKIVRFVRRCEMAVLAFRERLQEGQRLNFTAKIADWLL